VGRIIKGEQVAIDGTLQIGIALGQSGNTDPRAITGQPEVRIAEQHDDYMVIEFKCSCGEKSYLRCDYAPQATEQNEN